MAWQATLRPEMDAELPQRFKVWKRQVTSELRLQMAADPNKQQLWACTYVIVCAGEQGENVIHTVGAKEMFTLLKQQKIFLAKQGIKFHISLSLLSVGGV